MDWLPKAVISPTSIENFEITPEKAPVVSFIGKFNYHSLKQ